MSKREEMMKIIREGGSVLHRGVLYSANNPLPSEAELAKGDKEAEEAAKNYIKAQIAYYQEQLALLDEPAAPAPVVKEEKVIEKPIVEEEIKPVVKKEKK